MEEISSLHKKLHLSQLEKKSIMLCFQMPPLGGIPQTLDNTGSHKTVTLVSSRSGTGTEAQTLGFIKLVEESNCK